jgi:uncharacterized membrane protein YtjA (UPF0391 family)
LRLPEATAASGFAAELVPRRARIFLVSRTGTFVPGDDYFIECVTVACGPHENGFEAELVMLSWVVTFLIIALIAGILGFGGIAGVSIEIAKAVFFIAVVLFIISAVVGVVRGRTRA